MAATAGRKRRIVLKTYKEMKVLIADDGQNMLRTLANMLRAMGFNQIVRADNGETALSRVRSESPDLILSDWNMPHMTGVEFLRAVRDDEKFRALPFIMITGEVDDMTVAEAAEEEVDGYLLKPFTLQDMKNKIDAVLSRKREPSQIDVHLSLAKVYIDARQWEQALDEVKKAAKINNKLPRVSFAQGFVYENMGDMENARRMYERAVEFGSKFLKGHEALARVCKRLGDPAGAAKHLRTAVKISPKNLDRQLTLSKYLIEVGDTEQVSKVLQNVMLLAEKNKADIAREVGEAYLEAGLAEQAQHAFAAAMDANPSDVFIYNRMGIALRRQKKHAEAVSTYLAALKLEPENENLFYNLGRAYLEASDKDKAIAAMRRALKIDPEFQEARDFLVKVGATEKA